jgi:hypothetical protein
MYPLPAGTKDFSLLQFWGPFSFLPSGYPGFPARDKADHSLPSRAQVKNAWSITSALSSIIIVCAWQSTGQLYLNNRTSKYQVGSVNRSQMDIKRKPCDIRTCKKRLFLDISSTNIDTLVPSLYQCVKTRSIEVFWLLSATSASGRISSANFERPWENFSGQSWTALRDKHFPP